jgi:hypothetical protein
MSVLPRVSVIRFLHAVRAVRVAAVSGGWIR